MINPDGHEPWVWWYTLVCLSETKHHLLWQVNTWRQQPSFLAPPTLESASEWTRVEGGETLKLRIPLWLTDEPAPTTELMVHAHL